MAESIIPEAERPEAAGATADVFISYSSKDRSRARQLAEVLLAEGYQVYWDQQLTPGEDYTETLEKRLNSVRAVIVLWSKHSVQSDWVLNESRTAKQREVLIPVSLDGTDQPLDFRHLHVTDLSTWKGEARHLGLQKVVTALRELDIHGVLRLTTLARKQVHHDQRIALAGVSAGVVASVFLLGVVAVTLPATGAPSPVGAGIAVLAALGLAPALDLACRRAAAAVDPVRRDSVALGVGGLAGLVAYSIAGGAIAAAAGWGFVGNDPELVAKAVYRLLVANVFVFWLLVGGGLAVGYRAGVATGSRKVKMHVAVPLWTTTRVVASALLITFTGVAIFVLQEAMGTVAENMARVSAELLGDSFNPTAAATNGASIFTVLTFAAVGTWLGWSVIDERIRTEARATVAAVPLGLALLAGVGLVLSIEGSRSGIVPLLGALVVVFALIWGPWSTRRRLRTEPPLDEPPEPTEWDAMAGAVLIGALIAGEASLGIHSGMMVQYSVVGGLDSAVPAGTDAFLEMLKMSGIGVGGVFATAGLASWALLTSSVTLTRWSNRFEGFAATRRRIEQMPGPRGVVLRGAITWTPVLLTPIVLGGATVATERGWTAEANARKPEDTVMIIVAATDLMPGRPIDEQQIYAVEVPPRLLPENVFLSPEHVVGRVPRERILQNEFVRAPRLLHRDGTRFTSQIPDRMRAVYLPLDTDGQDIQPGHMIDLVAAEGEEAPACLVAEAARVLYTLEHPYVESSSFRKKDDDKGWIVALMPPRAATNAAAVKGRRLRASLRPADERGSSLGFLPSCSGADR